MPIKIHRTVKFVCLFMVLFVAACATQRPPTLTPFGDGEYWVLGNDLIFNIRDTGQRIVVPRGFVTDFASVPRVFWTFFPKHGEYTRAAIVHDFLYWEQKCSRDQADELFDIVMEDSEVDSTTRFSIYAAVRVWGGDAWDDNTEAKQQGYVRRIPEHYINFPVKTKWANYREFLRQMIDDSARVEEYPNNVTPTYCSALQEKEAAPEDLGQEPTQDAGEEPEEFPEPDPEVAPESKPVPESAIGA